MSKEHFDFTNTDIREQIIDWSNEAGPYLLLHADDGVIWGRIEDGRLTLAGDAYSNLNVELRWETVQQLRIFGPDHERFLWRGSDGMQTVLKSDSAHNGETLDEKMMLWGTVESSALGFSLCKEGVQGLLHAPPVTAPKGAKIMLKSRQYINYDQNDGQLSISNTRLVDFELSRTGEN